MYSLSIDNSSIKRIKKDVLKIMKDYLDDGQDRRHHIVEIEKEGIGERYNMELIDRKFVKLFRKQPVLPFF